MPDRILRAGLFDSEAWLGLKNNDDRVCYVSLLTHADSLGNQPAGPYRLISRWRAYGVDTPAKVAKVLTELADVDLILCYTVDAKQFVHIQRFRQSLRYPGHLFALHPTATPEEIQVHRRKSPVNLRETPAGVGVEVLQNQKKQFHPSFVHTPTDAQPVDNFTTTKTSDKGQQALTWTQFWTTKGKAFGINPNPGEATGDYCRRVQAHAKVLPKP
jgi:hypothetical protein